LRFGPDSPILRLDEFFGDIETEAGAVDITTKPTPEKEKAFVSNTNAFTDQSTDVRVR